MFSVRSLSAKAILIATTTSVVLLACSTFGSGGTLNPGNDDGGGGDGGGAANDGNAMDGSTADDASSKGDGAAPVRFCSTQDATFCDDFERSPADIKGLWANTSTPLDLLSLVDTTDQTRILSASVGPGQHSSYLRFVTPKTTNHLTVAFTLNVPKAVSGYVEIVTFEPTDSTPFQLLTVIEPSGELTFSEEYTTTDGGKVEHPLYVEDRPTTPTRYEIVLTDGQFTIRRNGSIPASVEALKYPESLLKTWFLSIGAGFADIKSGGSIDLTLDDVTFSWE